MYDTLGQVTHWNSSASYLVRRDIERLWDWEELQSVRENDTASDTKEIAKEWRVISRGQNFKGDFLTEDIFAH